jgi:hypothetical protein
MAKRRRLTAFCGNLRNVEEQVSPAFFTPLNNVNTLCCSNFRIFLLPTIYNHMTEKRRVRNSRVFEITFEEQYFPLHESLEKNAFVVKKLFCTYSSQESINTK